MRSTREILSEVKALAIEYYAATGKPLGVTGEIAEAEAARLLQLELADARAPGFDALDTSTSPAERIQIKGRRVGPRGGWGRVPSIKLDHEFDTVMLVLLASDYEVAEIWRARREAVVARLTAPGSKARNERKSMGVSQFKSIAERIWPL